MCQPKEMGLEEAERSNGEGGKGRKFTGKMANPCQGVKKSDIWLLVVFPAEIQGKSSPTSLSLGERRRKRVGGEM